MDIELTIKEAKEIIIKHSEAVYGFPSYDDCFCSQCEKACKILRIDFFGDFSRAEKINKL